MLKKKAVADKKLCVACGLCAKVCPLAAIEVINGLYAKVDEDKCVGCSKCVKECPASVIGIKDVEYEG